MKRYSRIAIISVMLAGFVLVVGCAGTGKYMVKATPIAAPSPDKALVYFMRPSSMAFAISYQIWDSDHFVGLTQARSYFAYACDPGTHLFLGFAENKVALEADMEAGKTYYVITNMRVGAMKSRMLFTPVTRGSEFWDKVKEYEESLSFIAVKEEERTQWEAAKKQEALAIKDYFTNGEGKAQVVKLRREDGR